MSWKLKPSLTAIREGRTERKTALETTGSTIRRIAFSSPTLQTRTAEYTPNILIRDLKLHLGRLIAALRRARTYFHLPRCLETRNLDTKSAVELASPVGSGRRNVMNRTRFVVIVRPISCHVLIQILNINVNRNTEKQNGLIESV
jgi:hypothetical protein